MTSQRRHDRVDRTRFGPWMALVGLILLGATVAGTSQAGSKAVRVAGTSLASGTVDITIESFFKPGLRDPDPQGKASPASLVSVPIPISSTASNSASLIASAINASLGPGYNAYTVTVGDPSIVQVDRDGGAFSMSIVATVAGQTVTVLEPFPSPAMTPVGLLLLGGVLLTAGLLGRRRLEVRETA